MSNTATRNDALAQCRAATIEKARAHVEWLRAAQAWVDPDNATQHASLTRAEASYWAADQAWYDAWYVVYAWLAESEMRQ